MKIEAKTVLSPADMGIGMAIRVTDIDVERMAYAIYVEIARAIAERFVADNYQSIAALLDQNAIANLSVAEAGAKLRESLEKSIPGRTVIERHVDRQVWQRGLLGGVKRVL